MKLILYTTLLFIIDVLVFGTIIFILMNFTRFFTAEPITLMHYIVALFFYIFIEGIRTQITGIYEYMKKELK